MVKYAKQDSPEAVWVVAFDTLVDGWDATKDENEDIVLFEEWEADNEVSEDPEGLFKIHKDEYIHHRKLFLFSENTKGNPLGYIYGENIE